MKFSYESSVKNSAHAGLLFGILGLVFVALFVIFLTTTQAASVVSSDGLVSYWFFDEGEGTNAADAVNGNDATLQNDEMWRLGIEGGAISASDASSYASASGEFPTGNAARTLNAWFKHDTGNWSGLNGEHIVNYGAAATNNAFGFMLYTNNHWYFYGHGGEVDIDTGIVADNEWHMHTITYDGTLVRYYLDGVEVATTARSLSTEGGDIYFGNRMDANGLNVAHGTIDEVALWDRALFPEVVERLYAEGTALAYPFEGNEISITSCEELQRIGNVVDYQLDGAYVLANNIDCSLTNPDDQPAEYDGSWQDGTGFIPIGRDTGSFTGSFDGDGYSISNLYIDRGDDGGNIGLFDTVSGSVHDVTLINPDISVENQIVGGLVGYVDESATLERVGIQGGSVRNVASNVGGLVGMNYGTISDSYASTTVQGPGYKIGGLVGANAGMIERSFARGSVSGGYSVGGLVGRAEQGSSIVDSHARASVSGTGNTLGGLVGGNGEEASVTRSFALGTVEGTNETGGFSIGGLTGDNDGSITNSFAAVEISVTEGYTQVGAIVGYEGGGATLSGSGWWSGGSAYAVNDGDELDPGFCFSNPSLLLNPANSFYVEAEWDFDEVWTFHLFSFLVRNSGWPHLRVLSDSYEVEQRITWPEEIPCPIEDEEEEESATVEYRFIRWDITEIRGAESCLSDSCVQVSDFVLVHDGNVIAWPAETVATNPSGDNPLGEGPESSIDALDSTKWLDHNFDQDDTVEGFSRLLIDTGEGNSVVFSGYYYITGNDEEDRDPVSWKLFGSADGVSWDRIDVRINETITTNRSTATDTYAIEEVAAVPRVLSTTPADETTDVSVDTNSMTVRFMGTMDEETMSVQGLLCDEECPELILEYDGGNNVLNIDIISPDPLEYDTTYWFRVDGDDDHGVSMDSYEFSFTTEEEDPLPPEVTVSPVEDNEGVNLYDVLKVNGARWTSVASSLDGEIIAASGMNIDISDQNSYLYISRDGGDTWNLSLTESGVLWTGIDMSPDGETMFAVGLSVFGEDSGAVVYRSNNAGESWEEVSGIPFGEWMGVEFSLDEMLLTILLLTRIEVSEDLSHIYINMFNSVWHSTNYGETWSLSLNLDAETGLMVTSVSAAATGTPVIATALAFIGGQSAIFFSVNGEDTWSQGFGIEGEIWFSSVISPDGTRIALTSINNESLYILSQEQGMVTVPHPDGYGWLYVKMASSDGMKMVASSLNTDEENNTLVLIYTSEDGGFTWERQATVSVDQTGDFAEIFIGNLSSTDDLSKFVMAIFTDFYILNMQEFIELPDVIVATTSSGGISTKQKILRKIDRLIKNGSMSALQKYVAEHKVRLERYGRSGIKLPSSVIDILSVSREPEPVAIVPVPDVRDLELGMIGEDVLALQKLLNANGFLLAQKGVGSPGNETSFFGVLTRAALAKYQLANGIAPTVGYFGPITRMQMKALGLMGLWW